MAIVLRLSYNLKLDMVIEKQLLFLREAKRWNGASEHLLFYLLMYNSVIIWTKIGHGKRFSQKLSRLLFIDETLEMECNYCQE